LHQIGSGVLGPVFRTYEPQRDRLIAVKAFKLDLLPEDVVRLADALRRLAGARLSHAAIVPVIDAGLEGTTAFVAMEYVTAETLDIALRHLAPAPLDVAVQMLSSLADAVDAAWAAGFGHLALHPRDIFVSPGTNDVLVTGFGIAPALEAIGVKAVIRRPYSASDPAWTVRSDIYSLGVIAHELLTKRRPAGPGEQDGALAPGITPEQRVLVRRVLGSAMADRPEDRFGSASAFADALAAIARGQTPASLPDVAAPVRSERIEAPAGESITQADFTEVEAATPLAAAAGPAEILSSTPPGSTPTVAERSGSIVRPDSVVRESRPVNVRAEPFIPPVLTVPPAPPPFPWIALIAAVIAALVVGGLVGYEYGQRRARATLSAVGTGASVPTDTDVAVPRPAAPAPVTPPPVAAAPPPAATAPPPVVVARPPQAQAQAQTPPPAAARGTSGPGQIVIHSVPEGATVTINGRSAGAAPQTIRDLPFGAYVLRATRSGYVSGSEEVTLSRGTPWRNVTIRLQPAPASVAQTGSLAVNSRPPGARVTVDGRAVGATPLRLPSVSVGSHTVRLELDGYTPISTTVVIKAGAQTPLAVTLEKR
jgi:serine/threonine protein kinase